MSDLFGCNCPHCGQPMPEQEEQSFTSFWKSVPHKVGKAEARKEWLKLSTPEKADAHKYVAAFYAAFKANYPNASLLHPVRYLKHKRWLDDGLSIKSPSLDRVKLAAETIKKGMPALCSRISASLARECVQKGYVTIQQCVDVGLISRREL